MSDLSPPVFTSRVDERPGQRILPRPDYVSLSPTVLLGVCPVRLVRSLRTQYCIVVVVPLNRREGEGPSMSDVEGTGTGMRTRHTDQVGPPV